MVAYIIHPDFEIFPPVAYFLVVIIDFQICSLQVIIIIQVSIFISKKDFFKAIQIYERNMATKILY